MDDWAHRVFSYGASDFSLSSLAQVAVIFCVILVAINRCLRSAAGASCNKITECN